MLRIDFLSVPGEETNNIFLERTHLTMTITHDPTYGFLTNAQSRLHVCGSSVSHMPVVVPLFTVHELSNYHRRSMMAIHCVQAQLRCIARLFVKTDPLVKTFAILAINPNARNKTERRDVSSSA